MCPKLCTFLVMETTCLLLQDSVPVWTKMHLLKLQSRWKTAKLRFNNWLFSNTGCQFLHKQLCSPSISTFWPWWEATLPGSKICGGAVRGENMFIRHHPQLLALPDFCWLPTVNKALIGGTGTLPAGTRWGGCIHLQFWDEKTQRCVLLGCLSLFAHIISTLMNSAQLLALVTRLKGRIKHCLHFA